MEPEVKATTSHPRAWVNDWDLLSPAFQREATAYLQVVGVVVALFLVTKRARARTASGPPVPRSGTASAGDTVPSGTVSGVPSTEASP